MHVTLSFPLGLILGLPTAILLIALATWRQRANFRRPWHAAVLTTLRAVAMLLAVLLIAAPMYVESQEDLPERSGVVVLVDRSESMALTDRGPARLKQALAFLRERLVPALRAEQLRPTAMTFADDVRPTTGEELARLVADGRRSNVGRALLGAVAETDPPPRAIVLVSDGAANESSDNQRAISALIGDRVPVIAIGLGSETGPRTLAVQTIEAPGKVPPKQSFQLSATLESGGAGDLPAFDVILLRDDQFVDKRTVPAGTAGRTWLETFSLSHDEEGIYRYTVRVAAPESADLRVLASDASATVRVTDEKSLRVLFVQGALTWDYKFIRMALLGDPAIRLTGLSRTSNSSFFYQNVEDSDELKNGFPTKVEQLAPFSVVVLANIRHNDLTTPQQETLAKFCNEYGGGVLMIGGPETFDASWRDSRLEELLAVRFAPLGGTPPESPFTLRVTPEALANPVFRVSDVEAAEASWSRLPPFTNYARVDSVKKGAEIWAVHPQDRTADGPRVLMASQRFGSGRSAVIGVQNFWRWRLARDSDPKAFDRFWQQLLRHLAEGGREQLSIVLSDQTLEPHAEIRFAVQRQAAATDPSGETRSYVVRVTDDQRREIARQAVDLVPGRAADVAFRSGEPGGYSIEVLDARETVLASRSVEIRDANLEWRRPARDMGQLEQWAAVSHGAAVKIEECDDVRRLVHDTIARADEAVRTMPRQEPAGMNGWTMIVLLGCLASEWMLRKRWGLT